MKTPPEREGDLAAPELSEHELAAQEGLALPDREAMSTVGFDPSGWDNFAMPINEALAINYQSTDSIAFADAEQTVIMTQAAQDPDASSVSELTEGD